MKKTLSPYYITTPFVSPATGLTCTDYTLYIYVWKGLKASVPASASYEITKTNATGSTGNDDINISRIINDFIDFTPLKDTETNVLNSNNQVWVKTEVTYTTTDPTDASTPQLAVTDLFVYGYGYGIEGTNTTTPTNKLMFENVEYKVSRTSYTCLPVDVETYNYVTDGALTIKSYPDLQINDSFNVTSTTDSDGTVRYVWVDLAETTSDEYVEVIYNGYTATLLITDECRYTPIDIHFINKEGQQQSLTFFKAKVEDMAVNSEEFEADRGQPNIGQHQFVKYNVNARTKYKINSGFVDEDNNEAFKQLMLTTRAWTIDNDTFNPINVKSRGITYKTRQKDRLINYEFEFEYAYNEINNI